MTPERETAVHPNEIIEKSLYRIDLWRAMFLAAAILAVPGWLLGIAARNPMLAGGSWQVLLMAVLGIAVCSCADAVARLQQAVLEHLGANTDPPAESDPDAPEEGAAT